MLAGFLKEHWGKVAVEAVLIAAVGVSAAYADPLIAVLAACGTATCAASLGIDIGKRPDEGAVTENRTTVPSAHTPG